MTRGDRARGPRDGWRTRDRARDRDHARSGRRTRRRERRTLTELEGVVAEITAAGGEVRHWSATWPTGRSPRPPRAGGVRVRADRRPRQQRGHRQQRRSAAARRVQGRLLGRDPRAEPDGAVPALQGGVAAHAGARMGPDRHRRLDQRPDPVAALGAYVASKHGVIGLMRMLALEHASEGITVNCVYPGPVRTRGERRPHRLRRAAAGTRGRGLRAGADADRRPPRARGHRADGSLPGR